ncbi:TlyA family RNA methyltransferase [Helicobacter cholecystus]|uniref:TlyA family RNA methyltransferase n=1 Tax=Helicobacter cholecystus TaxID=45498 RepID=A0A3D8IWX3_9HELI|nr:TlyA family RNA methyltransferase [Helicobacter cholecystus]RDU69480.1 TlyA family RNA methyltransferase [Helicobacter cholecystus]VEJ24031.1 hemolysin [Helicobacter cholecystus]
MRLDIYLYKHSFAQSRQKAQELIANSCVLINEKICTKNSYEVLEDDRVGVCGERVWVSRAGGKLEGFLQNHDIVIQGKRVLDIGSSTGGFSEVLLEYGAKEIVCVDVGSNQLHPSLKENPKITCYENTDIREFVSEEFELVVCDVSFISLRLIFQSILSLCKDECILLFKPQFEVGKQIKRNKRGVIKEREAVQNALDAFVKWIKDFKVQVLCVQKSQVKGKSGNEEYFIYWKKS